MRTENTTFIAVPADVSDPETLKRFLQVLIEQLDVAFSNRAKKGFASTGDIISVATSVNQLVKDFNVLGTTYLARDGSVDITGDIKVSSTVTPSSAFSLVTKGYVDSEVASIPVYQQQPSPATLPPNAPQSDIISTINGLIVKLQLAGIFN